MQIKVLDFIFNVVNQFIGFDSINLFKMKNEKGRNQQYSGRQLQLITVAPSKVKAHPLTSSTPPSLLPVFHSSLSSSPPH